jgi:hypothetical protein
MPCSFNPHATHALIYGKSVDREGRNNLGQKLSSRSNKLLTSLSTFVDAVHVGAFLSKKLQRRDPAHTSGVCTFGGGGTSSNRGSRRAGAQKAAAVLFVLPSMARVSSFYPGRRQSDALLDLSGQEIGSLVA